jgi:hypothetical protein
MLRLRPAFGTSAHVRQRNASASTIPPAPPAPPAPRAPRAAGRPHRPARTGRTAAVGLAAALLLSGCGAAPALPMAGSPTPMVMRIWGDQDQAPTWVETQGVRQGDAAFGAIDLDQVLVRMPDPDGVMYVQAPHALYRAEARSSLIMDGPDPYPVRFAGAYHGVPVVGRAHQALLDRQTRTMVFDQVEVVHDCICQVTDWVRLREDHALLFGPLRRAPDTPAVFAALAALPAPLVFPPLDLAP